MNSLKDLRRNGLKGLRENGLKGLKVSSLKDLVLKPDDPRTEDISDMGLEDLIKKREDLKIKIRKLIREKKEIEVRLDLNQKAGNKICEDKTPEDKAPEEKVSDKKMPEEKMPEEKTPGEKVSEGRKLGAGRVIIANEIASEAEEVDLKKVIGKKAENKAFPEKVEKIRNSYPFSAGNINENKNSGGNFGGSSIEKSSSIEINKPESKKDSATSLFGENLIEELLNSDDLNPEEEKGFTRYLKEPEMGELINDLKDIKSLLAGKNIQIKAE